MLQFSVALLFGAGLPVLYTIALISCILQYTVDRFLVCYFYREPPAFNESMTLVAIKSLRLFAVVSCLGTWFILRSDEIFQEENSFKTDKTGATTTEQSDNPV